MHFRVKSCNSLQQACLVGHYACDNIPGNEADMEPYIFAVVKHEECRAIIGREIFPARPFLQERLAICDLETSDGCLIHGPDVGEGNVTFDGCCDGCRAGNLKKAGAISYKGWLLRQHAGLNEDVCAVIIDRLVRV